MKDYALLIGNDINNIRPGKSWAQLLKDITEFCGVKGISLEKDKPFPMLYEEIFLTSVRNKMVDEKDLKAFIGRIVSEIEQNEIHDRIRKLQVQHIMTTNYEFSLEGIVPEHHTSVINETLYSIFRRYQSNGTTYWHIHGDCNNPRSINLGYEHYCGQLQNMRNYVITGTFYKSDTVLKDSLVRRLKDHRPINYQSWIDLFFTRDIYILGLGLDFIESDLWWLLTYRARCKFYQNKLPLNNRLYYFTPAKYEGQSRSKLELLKANDVEVIIINEDDRLRYYQKVLNQLVNI